MAKDLVLQIKIELQTAQGESALKRFDAAVTAALAKLRNPQDVAILKRLAADVEAGKKKLSEIPEKWRQDVATISQISRGVRLLDDLGIKQSHAQIRASMAQLQQDFAALKAAGVLTQSELAQATARVRDKVRELAESMDGARTIGQRLGDALGGVQRAFALLAAATTGAGIFKAADDMELLRARLALVEGGSGRAGRRLKELFELSQRSGAGILAAGESYAKFAFTLRGIGRSGEDALKLTEALALALRVSGADAAQTSAVMLQLGQALQRGKLSGDEFTSVAENGGRVLDYLALALRVSRGELLRMAQAGELTTDKVLKLSDALDQIRKDADQMPQTVGDAARNVSNAFQRWVSDAQSIGIAGRAIISTLNFVAEHFNTIVTVAMAGALALLATKIGAVIAAIKGVALAAGAALAAMSPWGVALAAVGTAAALAWQPLQRLWARMTDGDGVAQTRRAIEDLSATLGTLHGAAQTAATKLREALDEDVKRAADAIRGIKDAYSALTGDVKVAMDRRLASVEAAYQAQLRAAQQAAQSEAQAIHSGVQALLAAERDKMAVIEAGAAEMQDAWRRAYGVMVDLARAAGQDVQAIEREALQARLSIYSEIESAYKATIDRLIAEEQRHLDAVRRAEEERRDLRLSVEDRIRELARRGMSEEEAYADRLRQVDEKKAAARTALQQGQYDMAKRLAQDAIALAERAASVSDSVVPKQQAAAAAIAHIRDAASIADAALQGLSGAHQQAADAAAAGAAQARQALESVRAEIDAMRAQLQSHAALQLQVKTDDAEAAIARLQALVQAQKLALALQLTTEDALHALETLKTDVANTELLAQVRASTDRVQADIDALQKALADTGIELGISFDDAREGLRQFRADTEQALSQPTSSTHTVKVDTDKARAAIDELKKPTSSTHTVYVRQVQARASGGLVMAVPGFAAGGQALGAAWRRIAGRVFGPGTSTSDSVPAMLSAGEYVIRADAVRRYGVALLDAINGGRAAVVPMPAVPMLAPVTGGGAMATDEVRIVLQAPGHEPVRVRSDRDEALRLVRLLRSAGISLGVA
jgi:tape measure domain-containing protein